MALFKKAIFLGRKSEDTGYSEYLKLAQKHKLNLDVYTDRPNASELIPDYDFAFVSRYLAILESLAAGVPVIAHYNNEIKRDYLSMAPFAPFINIFHTFDKVNLYVSKTQINKGQVWAKKQTWEKLVRQYEELWKK